MKGGKIFISGAAGFIGFHLSSRLVDLGHQVLGVDNLSYRYLSEIQAGRLRILTQKPGFEFRQLDLLDRVGLGKLCGEWKPDVAIHLAAAVGVRGSANRETEYREQNVEATRNLLSSLSMFPPSRLLFTSSSSVYGGDAPRPFLESDVGMNSPSEYGRSKRQAEGLISQYGQQTGVPVTIVRPFTVYGPWGRPDMAFWTFAELMKHGKPIPLHTTPTGQYLTRDFTYVGDVVEAIVRLVGTKQGGEEIVNIGSARPVTVSEFAQEMAGCLGLEWVCQDVAQDREESPFTFANNDRLAELTGYRPTTLLEAGIRQTVGWYKGMSESGRAIVA